MTIDKSRNTTLRVTETADPRSRLAREKHFSLRPKPLERWLWQRKVSAAAERVFWFHWAEGHRNGDWCSQFSLHYVAKHCEVDPSTVTRAYQTLKRLGLVRRVDPGRDPTNPFEQATSVTEVLIPAKLMSDLSMAPNRLPSKTMQEAPVATAEAQEPHAAPPAPTPLVDLKHRRERLKQLALTLSPTELARWNQALCGNARRLEFDAETQVPGAVQTELNEYLASRTARVSAPTPTAPPGKKPSTPRRLSMFDIARVRRGLQAIAPLDGIDEMTRQILWSIEEGALQAVGIAHGINIALKKIREGDWRRPHRMPPNWLRRVSSLAAPETCVGA